MLILTRRPVEEIDITSPSGEKLTFVVLGVKGNQVRIGIEAPNTQWIIDRREITIRKIREKPEAEQEAAAKRMRLSLPKPHACPMCELRFVTAAALGAHLANVHGTQS